MSLNRNGWTLNVYLSLNFYPYIGYAHIENYRILQYPYVQPILINKYRKSVTISIGDGFFINKNMLDMFYVIHSIYPSCINIQNIYVVCIAKKHESSPEQMGWDEVWYWFLWCVPLFALPPFFFLIIIIIIQFILFSINSVTSAIKTTKIVIVHVENE